MSNYDLGTLWAETVSYNNYTVSPSDPADVFKFNLSTNRNISLNLHDISNGDNANLTLYRDSNFNGVLDNGDLFISFSAENGNADDVIDVPAITGTYFARVNRYAADSIGSVSYDLDLSTNLDVGTLWSSPVSYNNDFLSSNNPVEVYEFDIANSRTINLSVHDVSSGDNVDLRLYQDNGNGIFDDADTLVDASIYGDDELINYRGSAGTYFAEVRRNSYNGGLSYDLDMSATSHRAGNLVAAEKVVGDITNVTPDQTGNIGNFNTADTYAFSLETYEGVNIELLGLTDNANMRLIRDNNQNGIIDGGEIIEGSYSAGSSNEQINNVTLSGDYFLQVYQGSAGSITGYTLEFDHFSTPYA
ncbi:MAG: pre-peptidase C-terminal domain-containing protein [Cyanobacteria bacterium P01_A01_bin.114]